MGARGRIKMALHAKPMLSRTKRRALSPLIAGAPRELGLQGTRADRWSGGTPGVVSDGRECGGHLHEEPGDAQVQEVPGVSSRAASRWRVQGAHLSHAFYVVPSSPTSIGSVGRRGAISGTSGAGSASWLGGGLANRVCPGSQDGASPLAQRWCAGRGMAGGEGSGAFLFPTLD